MGIYRLKPCLLAHCRFSAEWQDIQEIFILQLHPLLGKGKSKFWLLWRCVSLPKLLMRFFSGSHMSSDLWFILSTGFYSHFPCWDRDLPLFPIPNTKTSLALWLSSRWSKEPKKHLQKKTGLLLALRRRKRVEKIQQKMIVSLRAFPLYA